MRRAGLLIHPTSLPGPGPCGTLGAPARRFLDWLADAGCSLWQVLPLNPPSLEGSPYDSPSIFALDTRLLDLDDLVEDGLLPASCLSDRPAESERIEPTQVQAWHAPRVAQAARRLVVERPDHVQAFAAENPWVRDWALFSVLRTRQGGRGWWTWPESLQRREASALRAASRDLATEIEEEIAAQALVHDQWMRLRSHAQQRGILIIGDLPIFVCRDGADTWTDRPLFRFGADDRPDPTTGAPPDDFNECGQWWNNPHYNWARHTETDFAWWIERLRTGMARHDVIRVDHFRGLCAAWAIPRSAEGDARLGQWEPAPGANLLRAARARLPALTAIAEDLGLITPDVVTLREQSGWPGMKVLQFAFDAAGTLHLPPYTGSHWVVYTGTHDNDTTRGWYTTASEDVRAAVSDWAGTSHPCPDPAGALLEGAWSSNAEWAIAPLQDLLRLGSEARMNRPGTKTGNWAWRAQALTVEASRALAEITERCDRRAPPAPSEGI